ncbi:FG-GAP repeat protein [Streptomyces sp. NRRL F-6491]|nr:FG-GAP repeat protein [Streptomyces sp. NRRL F-6491]KOX44860.1 FG-GAP repeat protein [Streptomyces sp. NRRL F-6492]
MTSRWRRAPGRRALAAGAAAAVLATGLTYVGLGRDGDEASTADTADSKEPRVNVPVGESEAAARAAKTGKPVEATALRTAYSTTWAKPGGTMLRKIHASPVRAKVDGVWKPVDTGLEKVAGGWAPKSVNTPMVFSGGAPAPAAGSGTAKADQGAERASRASVRRVSLLSGVTPGTGNTLATLTVGDHQIVMTWPEAIPTPVIDGSRALYPEILPGADLVLTADDGGFAQLLVVKTRAAAANPKVATLSYGLSSPDLTFSLDPLTNVVSALDENGTDIAESPTPLMWDSAGVPATTDGQGGGTATPGEEVLPTETPDESASGTPEPDPEDSASASPEPTDSVNDGDDGDLFNEALPEAGDEAADPSATSGTGPEPTAPPEASPEPSQTGPAATLSLPALNGPQPDSHGTVVATDLEGSNWTISADQEFLNDPSTVYPVFIDPSVNKHTNDWTTAYSRHKNASFYNGKNFNKGGTHEARVGYESDTWGTSRSFFSIDWDKDLQGAVVTGARLYALETYAWSCSARSMDVHITTPISSKTNWNNAPSMHSGNRIGGGKFSHGWKSASCPDKYVSFDVKPTAQRAVNGGWPTMTIGFKAVNENDQFAWKKFQADGGNDPHVLLEYNRRPKPPSNLDLAPDFSCDTTAPYINVGSSTLTFWASAEDKDGNLSSVNFEMWPTGGSGNMLGTKGRAPVGGSSGTTHTDPFATGSTGLKLVNGQTYSWRAKTVDKTGSSSVRYSPEKTPCRFVFDSARPSPPTVVSTDFPDADALDNGFGSDGEDSLWSKKKFGETGTFQFRAAQTDVDYYEFGFNQGSYPFKAERTAGAATTTVTSVTNAKPPLAGPNVLYVRAVDDAGHKSEPRKYLFYLSPRDEADAPGDFTGDRLPDLMVVDANGNLRLYPSEHQADLAKGTGDLGFSMAGAYRSNPAKDPNGNDGLPTFSGAPSGYWKGTLITHLGDVYGGDGFQDLIARKDGKLWVYPGDGYGAVNIDKRQQIVLPSDAPDPATYRQIVSAGDATGDGKTDLFVTTSSDLWMFIGYNGATVDDARRLSATAWTDRDLVTAQDINKDGITDLLYRSDTHAKMFLRLGKPASGGGVDPSSLAAAVDSASPGGVDISYTGGGWSRASIPLLTGTPDANGNGVPDVWTLAKDGAVRFYGGETGVLPGAGTVIIANNNGVGWTQKLAIG